MPESNFYEYSKENSNYDCVIAIKISEIDFWTEEKFIYPISELDEYVLEDFIPNNKNLKELLSNNLNGIIIPNNDVDFNNLPF